MDLKQRAEQYGKLYPEDAAFALAHPEAIGIIASFRASYSVHMKSIGDEHVAWGFRTETAYQHVFVEKCPMCRQSPLFQNPVALVVLAAADLTAADATVSFAISKLDSIKTV